MPPAITPNDIARAGFSVNGERIYVPAMTIPLNRTGVNPDGAKILQPFNIP